MKNICLFLLLLCSFSACSLQKVDTTNRINYHIYFGDRLAGTQESWIDEAGYFRYTYEFNDRGRGPRYEEKVLIDEDGIKTYHEIIGHNYLKDSVYEVFDMVEDVATWESSSESGRLPYDGSSFYASVEGSLAAQELLIRSLLEAEDQTLGLLPSGKAKILSVNTHTLQRGLKLNLFEISGFSFSPMYVWMDEENRFFASTSSWFSCIPQGKEDLIEELTSLQEAREDSYLQNLASTLTHTPDQGIAIENVTLFDVHTGNLLPNKTVIVLKNKIDKIQEAGGAIPKNLVVVDGKGKTLLPGLFDMHTHISNTDGILHLAAGVTSVRDMANSLDLPDLKADFDHGLLIGPRILVMSGFVDQAGPYAGPTGKIVKSLEEGLEGIAFYHERGYQQIKLYSSIDPKWVPALTAKAHELGMRISGHIPAFMTAEQAVKAGYDEIQHVNMLALNFLSDTLDTRTPLRFSMVAEHTHELDLAGSKFKNFLRLLRDNEIVIDPTVSIFEGMLTTRAGDPNPSFVTILERLPVQVARGYYAGGLPIPEGKQEQYQASFQKLLDIVRELYFNGITIVPGTDALAGFGLHRELENYVRAGIPEADVLRLATLVSAEVTGRNKDSGSIDPGKLADLILIEGNPLENISDIRKVVLSIKDGKIFDPQKLYEAVGVKPAKQ